MQRMMQMLFIVPLPYQPRGALPSGNPARKGGVAAAGAPIAAGPARRPGGRHRVFVEQSGEECALRRGRLPWGADEDGGAAEGGAADGLTSRDGGIWLRGMETSHRIRTVTGGGSDGWELFLRARGMIDAGQPVVELTIGEHDIRTAPAILDAMDRAARGGHTGYAAIPGTPALRAAVAGRIAARTGVATGPRNVIVMPGGQAGLFAALHATCAPQDTALYVDPYYATYPGTIRAAGAVPRAVAARPEDGFLPQPVAIAAAADAARAAGHPARALLVNTPNNPTGVIYDRATLEGMAEVCVAQDLWLISDEVYDTQVWEGAHLSPRALPGMEGRTLVVGSMSKSHAMTGSRIGWVCGPGDAIGDLITFSTHTTYGLPGYIQDAALFALNAGAPLEEEIAAPFRRRRDLTLGLLAQQQVVRAARPQGGMYVMLDIRATGMTGEAFAHALLDAEHVAVMPGESFGAAAAGHVRVAMTVADEVYAEAFARLLRFAATRADARQDLRA